MDEPRSPSSTPHHRHRAAAAVCEPDIRRGFASATYLTSRAAFRVFGVFLEGCHRAGGSKTTHAHARHTRTPCSDRARSRARFGDGRQDVRCGVVKVSAYGCREGWSGSCAVSAGESADSHHPFSVLFLSVPSIHPRVLLPVFPIPRSLHPLHLINSARCARLEGHRAKAALSPNQPLRPQPRM